MSGNAQSANSWPDAADILAGRDPVIRRLLDESGPPQVRSSAQTPFEALLRAIVYQQLAGAAATAIHGRLIKALDDEITPERLLSLSAETLRAAGLSARKAASLQD